jgi:hypothetical protein
MKLFFCFSPSFSFYFTPSYKPFTGGGEIRASQDPLWPAQPSLFRPSAEIAHGGTFAGIGKALIGTNVPGERRIGREMQHMVHTPILFCINECTSI